MSDGFAVKRGHVKSQQFSCIFLYMPSDFGHRETHNISSESCIIREDKSISVGLGDRRLT